MTCMQAAEAQVEQQQKTANAHLGLFGQQAVSDVKQVKHCPTASAAHALCVMIMQLFWNGVEGAKGFAKRQTWWDMLFIGIRGMSRDQGLAEYVLEILFRFLMNLILGLFGNTVYAPLPALMRTHPCANPPPLQRVRVLRVGRDQDVQRRPNHSHLLLAALHPCRRFILGHCHFHPVQRRLCGRIGHQQCRRRRAAHSKQAQRLEALQ